LTSILNKEKILEQARLFIEEGKYDKAIREYEKILIADPSDMRVRLRVAELYAKRKQISDAIRVYGEVATAYTKEGFYLKAVTVYKNILKLNPSLIDVNEKLADLYEKMGLKDDAVRQYNMYAGALEHKGEMERVIEIRKKVVDLIPEDGSARIKLAELYQREGMNEEAIDQYEEYAHKLEQKGKDEAGLIEMYEKVLSYRSDREDMLRSLIRIYYRKGDKKKALKWLEFAKSLTTVDTELLGMQAEIYSSLNQAETARTKYLTLSDLYRENGDIDNVVDALAKIVMLIPGEQERVEKRAKDIGIEALEKFRKKLAAYQKEEEERIKREEEAEVSGEEVTAKAKKPVVEEEKKEEEEKEEEKPIVIPVAKRKEKKPVKKSTLKQAKAAYDLGMYYKKLGLDVEAKKELAKALKIYEGLEKPSSDIVVRISEIRVMVGPEKKKPAKKPEKKPEKKSEKKRKVSFV
jgi:tetratricopeptide (TPR) repeat protein